MKSFSKNETIGVTVILGIVVLLTIYNFRIALRRSRDVQRRGDVSAITRALDEYHDDFGFFPLNSDEGKIKACRPDNYNDLLKELARKEEFDYGLYLNSLSACDYGKDSLKDLGDPSYVPYLETIPNDPESEKNISYLYLSNGERFQLYAYLEGESAEIGYNQGIVKRNLNCGSQICNYGKSLGETPLEKSIEEYENELRENLLQSK